MCGFAGVIDLRNGGPPSDAQRAVLAALSRRGPDASNVWQEGPCTLLHCRLRVIDTQARADQPMERTSGQRVVMVYNGELYNYRALREELERTRWTFTTSSDAEVLLSGYLHWGGDVFGRARGMWAAAFWHPVTRQLLLARDPLGKKPLLYHSAAGRLVFASTMSALVELLETEPAVDPAAIQCYFGHLVVPFEHSVFQGVQKVPPASTVSWTPGRVPQVERYWRIPIRPQPVPLAAEAEVERLLRAAVRRRLESDVPLGLFLSAGYDSGLVAAIAAQESSRPLLAVTAGTAGSRFDERSAAALLAQRYGLDHRLLEMPPFSAASLPRLIADLGEPFGDASILPTYEVARRARQNITVALTGDGGDEAFFGYSTFQGVHWAAAYRRVVPTPARRGLHFLTGKVTRNGLLRRVAALFDYGVEPLPVHYRNRMAFDERERSALLRPSPSFGSHHAEHIYRDRLTELAGLPDADALRRTFYETYLVNDYLTKVDTATMAASLEARCPFLDVDLVEFVLGIPQDVAFPAARLKALLRPLARRLLPRELVARRKTGFAVPMGEWIRGPLRPAMEEFVFRQGTFAASLLDLEYLRGLVEAHQRGAAYDTQLWAILAFGVWGAVMVDRRWSPNDPLPVATAQSR